MIFGDVPLTQAKGAILAHSQTLPAGRLAKGMVLEANHITQLQAAGIETVTVARLDADDMGENAAASMFGHAFCAADPNLRMSNAHTGRVNLYARASGVMAVDRDAINGFNAINPMVTIATVPQFQRLSCGDMVATIKIISYGVPNADVSKAADQAAQGLRLHTAVRRQAVLIETKVAGQTLSDKGANALEQRLNRLDASLQTPVHCDHTVAALAQSLLDNCGGADVIFILTGSATSDPADTGPAGLIAAGGELHHFGMPVDPGNLLFIGALGDVPVIGLPGCARALALNGADWVLERIICGLSVGGQDIQNMGVGGLLKEIAQRGHPRDPQ